MKKQLLIAAVAASMTSVAMADISISGAAKVNAKGGAYTTEADLTITGKSGGTSVVAKVSLDEDLVEQLYATSSVAGISLKVGEWKSGKGELGKNQANGSVPMRVAASTSFGGVKLSYADTTGAGGTNTAIAGTIAGVKISHKVHSSKSETKASGSMGGVSVSAHTKDYDAGGSDTSVTLKTEVQGVSLTYVDTSSDAGTKMDGFIGKADGVTSANALGMSTSIAGNKVTFKSIDINGTDNKKLIVTRGLSSGATFEATYDDNADSLDLELAVKF
ncbi:MAG: hypothetical protein NZ824_00305 [Candidatus Thioglobus sp.]|nr:hypothetical protein [Candidatus Thioglobus sp.]